MLWPLLQCHQKPSGLNEFLKIIFILCLSQLDIDLFFVFARSETISQFVRWGSVQDDLAVSQVLVTKQRNSEWNIIIVIVDLIRVYDLMLL